MRKILVIAFTLLPPWTVYAQSLQSRITTEVEQFFPDQFMGSVLVVQDDEVLYSEEFGYSNLEQETVLNQNSIFRIASLTKQFTAVAILLLEQEGALNTEDSITTHIQGLPAILSEVTLLQLLSHTSGISDIPNSAFNSDGNRALELTELQLESIALESLPEKRARYSNTGYHLLGEVVEAVSGMTYSEFISKKLLESLQLEQTGVFPTIPENLATGYFPDGGEMIKQENSVTEIRGPNSSGGMYSTAADLVSWTDALFGGEVLSETSMEKLITIQQGSYALGLAVSNENGRQRIYHTGALFGFSASLSYYPERDLTIVVLSNVNGKPDGDDAEIIAKSIEYTLYGDNVLFPSQTTEIELPESVFASFVGEYSIQPQGGLRISQDNDRLVLQFSGDRNRYTLLPLSENTFHFGIPFIHYEFLQNEAGIYSSLVLHQRGNEFEFVRQ